MVIWWMTRIANEGDLVMAAELATPEAINFMALHGRGLICLSLTPERCDQLQLPMMVQDNSSGFGTAFTVSIEASTGVTTGISAADRAHTVRVAVAPGYQSPVTFSPSGLEQEAYLFAPVRPKGRSTWRDGWS